MVNYQTAFCLNCKEEHKYKLVTVRQNEEVRGLRFSFLETQAICEHCGEEIYVAEIMDSNIASSQEAYRKAAKLITVDEIKKILEKYNIAAGPLAQILGFGDITVNRYLNGQLPSKANSDIMLEVITSVSSFQEYFNKNGGMLSPVAYNKCAERLRELGELYSCNKIDCVARYLLRKAEEITPLALQKLLYYVQSFSKALYHKEMFPEPCQAWAHGPVYPDIYYKYRKYGYNPIEQPPIEEDVCETVLTTAEITLIDSVISAFACYSGSVLRTMTHNERPWLEARGSLLPEDRSANEVSKFVMQEYFEGVVAQYHIVNPCDIKNYSSAMMKKLY